MLTGKSIVGWIDPDIAEPSYPLKYPNYEVTKAAGMTKIELTSKTIDNQSVFWCLDDAKLAADAHICRMIDKLTIKRQQLKKTEFEVKPYVNT